MIRERLGLDARRGIQSRGGAEAADVVTALFHVECKLGKRPNPLAALAQAIADARPGLIPVAFCRRDREGWTVTMDAEDWCQLARLLLGTTGDITTDERALQRQLL